MNDTTAKVQMLVAVAINRYVDENYDAIGELPDSAEVVRRLRATADGYERASRYGVPVTVEG